MSEVCEHGHQQRKCEVCELKAEVERLRGVCRSAGDAIDKIVACGNPSEIMRTWLLLVSKDLANEGSKEDGK